MTFGTTLVFGSVTSILDLLWKSSTLLFICCGFAFSVDFKVVLKHVACHPSYLRSVEALSRFVQL